MPHVFIEWLTRRGDVVYDPFSGRGTTAFEACLMGRRGFGSDLNPLACVLSGAKVAPPKLATLESRLRVLRRGMRPLSVAATPAHVRMLFAEQTLGQLLWLRRNLNQGGKTDRFILAALLGVLHANADSSGRPRGLTVAMPNTFSMSPGYVQKYIRDHGLQPPSVNPLDVIERRLGTLELPSDDQFVQGVAWRQNATSCAWGRLTEPAKLIFTSPPYLHVILYGKFNWLRLWLLGQDRRGVDQALFTSRSLGLYLDFMLESVSSMRARLRPDGYICLVIGDVREGERETNLARAVARVCERETDLRLLGVVSDRLPTEHKVSRIWGKTKGRATRTDRIVVLGGPSARRPREVPEFCWDS